MGVERTGDDGRVGGVVIRTARLEIRRPVPADAIDIAANANDAQVAVNLRDAFPNPYTPADARAWMAMPFAHPLQGLVICRDDRAIGGIGLEPGVDVARHGAEVGYWLGAAHWGMGYMSEALAEFCDAAFATTSFQRLHAVVFDGNPASDRVLLKCGFALEGLARRAVVKHGRFLDARTYGRLKGDDVPGSA